MQATLQAIESYERSEYSAFDAMYDGDDQLHVECLAHGRPVRNDYGVPGSPVWYEIEDIIIDEFVVNGTTHTFKTLAKEFGDDMTDKLHEICSEVAAEKGEWE